ncbi:hypothetical protein F4806DRAFT_166189 [Annulohypoxylon nitens]|nr:hypothetical protein F4806DRAFT_166189 [Annulohypoxylon nitens]
MKFHVSDKINPSLENLLTYCAAIVLSHRSAEEKPASPAAQPRWHLKKDRMSSNKNNDSHRDLAFDPVKYGYTYEEVFGNRDNHWPPSRAASTKKTVNPSQKRAPAPVPTSHSIADLRITSSTRQPLFSRANGSESSEPDYYRTSPQTTPRKRKDKSDNVKKGYTWNSMAEMIAAHVEELKKLPPRGTVKTEQNTEKNTEQSTGRSTEQNTEQDDEAFASALEADMLAMFAEQQKEKTSDPKESASPADDDYELEEGEIDEREEGEIRE